MDTMTLQGVELILSQPTETHLTWVGNTEVKRQLQAAWLILSNQDLPMNPRVIGRPGIGKTTLAYAVAREYSNNVYIFQCTVDTRPEDLLVTPVIGSEQNIRYHASPLVTAMLTGGICILDEGNRMGEKSWASLAPLLDTRRYVESIVAGIKIPAHPDFRLAVTMNQDASTFDVPDYIQSRLQPQIEVGFPSAEEELDILKVNLPEAPEDVLRLVGEFLQRGHEENKAYTARDGVNIARYAVKLIHLNQYPHAEAVERALLQVLDEAAHAFFAEHCMSPPDAVLKPLEILLLGSSDQLGLRFKQAEPNPHPLEQLDELEELNQFDQFESLDALRDVHLAAQLHADEEFEEDIEDLGEEPDENFDQDFTEDLKELAELDGLDTVELSPEARSETKSEARAEVKPETKSKQKPESKSEPAPDTQPNSGDVPGPQRPDKKS